MYAFIFSFIKNAFVNAFSFTFWYSQSSEDGFTGRLDKANTVLDSNQQETIRVSQLRIPQKKNGEKGKCPG